MAFEDTPRSLLDSHDFGEGGGLLLSLSPRTSGSQSFVLKPGLRLRIRTVPRILEEMTLTDHSDTEGGPQHHYQAS